MYRNNKGYDAIKRSRPALTQPQTRPLGSEAACRWCTGAAGLVVVMVVPVTKLRVDLRRLCTQQPCCTHRDAFFRHCAHLSRRRLHCPCTFHAFLRSLVESAMIRRNACPPTVQPIGVLMLALRRQRACTIAAVGRRSGAAPPEPSFSSHAGSSAHSGAGLGPLCPDCAWRFARPAQCAAPASRAADLRSCGAGGIHGQDEPVLCRLVSSEFAGGGVRRVRACAHAARTRRSRMCSTPAVSPAPLPQRQTRTTTLENGVKVVSENVSRGVRRQDACATRRCVA